MNFRRIILAVVFVSTALVFNSCAPKISDQSGKIKFDLSQLNEDGLIGEGNNLVAIDYEFCIPKNDSLKAIVTSIDATVKLYSESKGRIGCGKEEILCVGNTGRKNAKETLLKLADLDFVKKIERTFYE